MVPKFLAVALVSTLAFGCANNGNKADQSSSSATVTEKSSELEKVGYSIAPFNSDDLAMKKANYVTKRKGGDRAVAEASIHILKKFFGASSKNQIINVTFKNGKSCTYNHDKVFEIMKDTLTKLPCWLKYKSYTSSTNVPVKVRSVVEVK